MDTKPRSLLHISNRSNKYCYSLRIGDKMHVTNVFKIEFFKTNVQLFYISKINWLKVSYFHRYCLPIKKKTQWTNKKFNYMIRNKAKKRNKNQQQQQKKPSNKTSKRKKMLLIKIEVNNIYILLKSMRIYLIVHIRRWYKYDMIE